MKKHKRRQNTISFIVAIFVVPIIIHCLFKIHPSKNFFSAEWSAGDLLTYYGAILAFVGVFISIQYAQKNYRQDTIYRSLPFMAITGLAHNRNFSPEEIKNDIEDYKLQKLYFVIRNGQVIIQDKLNFDQYFSVGRGGIRLESLPNGITLTDVRMRYIPLEIENVGNGAATTFSVGMDRKESIKGSHNFTLPRSLKVGESFYIAIFSENRDLSNVGDYSLVISYYDILGNAYEQKLIYTLKEIDQSFNAELRLDGTQVAFGKTDKGDKS